MSIIDHTAKLESAGYSRNGDVWEKTEDGLTLRVTPKSDGFKIEGQVKAGSTTRKMSFDNHGWSNFRRTEDAIRAALKGSLSDAFNEMLDGVDMASINTAFDRIFGTRPGRSRAPMQDDLLISRSIRWYRSHARTLLLAGIIVLGMILILA